MEYDNSRPLMTSNAGPEIGEVNVKPMTERQMVEFLFGVLDDIDTEGDICKENLRAFRNRVEQHHRRRFETGITSDGHKLIFPVDKR